MLTAVHTTRAAVLREGIVALLMDIAIILNIPRQLAARMPMCKAGVMITVTAHVVALCYSRDVTNTVVE